MDWIWNEIPYTQSMRDLSNHQPFYLDLDLDPTRLSQYFVRKGAEVFLVIAVLIYCCSFCRCWDRSYPWAFFQDSFKHLRRLAYIFQFLRVLLVAYIVFRALIMMQTAFVKAIVTGSKPLSAWNEGNYYAADDISLWGELSEIFRFDSLHSLTIHILLGLALVIANVFIALSSEALLLSLFKKVKAFFRRELMGGGARRARQGEGMVTRSKSRLLGLELEEAID